MAEEEAHTVSKLRIDANAEANAEAARRYGTVPFRDKLFPQESKHRTYFDSAEFALNSVHRPSEVCHNDIGTKHPEYAHISQPFCAVPGSSNVSQHANDGFHTAGHGYHRCDSHLHEDEADGYKSLVDLK
ncbi:hypothetical protein N7494_006516 [Penicillium frequentans]|uniref:mRNA stability protein n=1 Tax=Penicillium frequentans TaxID=3151616 RepID=A0AAD6GGR7_9EURO|nr:hypothetical protein N7494_006516 [Penicillium glabrum]